MRHPAPVAALAALLLAGCGGSQPLSTGELHVKAAQVCLRSGLQTDRIPTPGSPTSTTAFLKQGIAVMTPELAGLRALTPPPGDLAVVYAASIKAFAKKLSALRDTVRDLNGGEDPVIAIRTLQQELAPIESQENGGWEALQLPACVNR